jgi:hypothetical protein
MLMASRISNMLLSVSISSMAGLDVLSMSNGFVKSRATFDHTNQYA